jgi:hypothetical protein
MKSIFRGLKSIDVMIDSDSKFAGKVRDTEFYFMAMKNYAYNEWIISWWKRDSSDAAWASMEEIEFSDMLDEANPKSIQEFLYHLEVFSKKSIIDRVE